MRWNGTDITGVPTFIYHDELLTTNDSMITDPDGQGSLICRFEMQTTVYWSVVHGDPVSNATNGNFIQTRATGPPSLSRVALNSIRPITTPRTDDFTNGLWFCSANGMRLHVGLYGRAQGEIQFQLSG